MRYLIPVACIGFLALGCNNGRPPQNAAFQESPEFERLLDESMTELQQKTTDAMTSWGIGTFDRWDIDQTKGTLVFSNADGTKVEFQAQIIGTFHTRDGSWLWAWANSSITEPMRQHALKVKAYGEQHSIERLTQPRWHGEEADAWNMVALATKLCGATGAYRGPSGELLSFMTFSEVRQTQPASKDSALK